MRTTRTAPLAILALVGLPLLAAGPASAHDHDGGTELSGTLTELNDSGASGTAWGMLEGNELHITLETEGLLDGAPHAQHIHIGGTNSCPGADVEGTGPNGELQTSDGVPSYGDVALSLTKEPGMTSGDHALDVDNFPATASYTYDRTIEVDDATAEGLETPPPTGLRDRLLAEVAATAQDTPADKRAPAKRGWLLAGAAAAAISIGAVAVTQWQSDSPDPAQVAVEEVLEAPDATSTSEEVDGATVTVVTAYSLDRAVVLTEDMASAPEGQDYQLWFVHEDGTAVSAGLMPRDEDRVLLEGEPAGAVALGITLEPAGGSAQPSSDPIVAVPLEG